MKKQIQRLVEEYFSSTEQMNTSLSNAAKYQKQYDSNIQGRHDIAEAMLGKSILKKFEALGSTGTFAPVQLYGIRITDEDIQKTIKLNGWDIPYEQTSLFWEYIAQQYSRNDIRIVNGTMHTDIVFATMDQLIDFIICMTNAFAKVSNIKKLNASDIKWNPIRNKFKKYIE